MISQLKYNRQHESSKIFIILKQKIKILTLYDLEWVQPPSGQGTKCRTIQVPEPTKIQNPSEVKLLNRNLLKILISMKK